MNASLKTLKRRFIRCSAQATITHVKKFIAKKVLSGMEKYRDVSIQYTVQLSESVESRSMEHSIPPIWILIC
jgi:hypothetical protein